MNILAFDTSNQACTISLLNHEKTYFFYEMNSIKHGQIILKEITTLLKKADISLEDLDAIAFVGGPGSFTGIRMASSIAQAMAYGLKNLGKIIPLIKISSLALQAQAGFLAFGDNHFSIVFDAHNHRVFSANYEVKQGYVYLLDEETYLLPQEIKIINSLNFTAIGNGWEKYRDILLSASIQPTRLIPIMLDTSSALLDLAKFHYQHQNFTPLHNAYPNYIAQPFLNNL